MVVERYHMYKSGISTGQPEDFATDQFIEKDVQLKDDCGMISPHFIFNFGLTNPPRGTNYIRVPEWNNRCYWVTEWTFSDGLWEATCQEDYLASFKKQIGDAEAYIVRASNRYNTTIPDTLYPSTTDFRYVTTQLNMPWQTAENNGIFVVGIIGSQIGGLSSISSGAVTYFAFEPAQLQNLMDKIFDPNIDYMNINWDDIGGLTEELLAAMINPSQYIVSCKWFPFTKEQLGVGVFTKVYVGFWDLDVRAYTIQNSSIVFENKFMHIPKIPDQSRADFLYFAPYTEIKLYCPPFGEIVLDRTNYRSRRLDFDVIVDIITGNARLKIYGSAKEDETFTETFLMRTIDGQFGVDTPLQTASVNFAGGATGFLTSLGNDFFTTVGASGVGEFISTAGTAANLSNLSSETLFSAGSLINFFSNEWTMTVRYSPLVEMSVKHLGGLLYETHIIKQLGGYMKLAHPDFKIDGNKTEIDAIYAQCAEGFIYE